MLVPGAGVGRLPLDVATLGEGLEVEAVEVSPLMVAAANGRTRRGGRTVRRAAQTAPACFYPGGVYAPSMGASAGGAFVGMPQMMAPQQVAPGIVGGGFTVMPIGQPQVMQVPMQHPGIQHMQVGPALLAGQAPTAAGPELRPPRQPMATSPWQYS